MKFIEPLRKIHEESILKKGKPKIIRILSILILICSFGLYIADNMLWVAYMGIIKFRYKTKGFKGLFLFPVIGWRRAKDYIALSKNIIELFKYTLDALRNFKRQFDIKQKLSQMNDLIVQKGTSI